MGRPTGYNILGYGGMITSEPRMSAYAHALREAVTPGCTVVDIGAGPAVFSILACQYGAGSVVAIEPDDIIELGRQFAAANSCADRITFVQDLSTNYQPQCKADVVISDIRGGLPLFEGHIPTIVDARERLLRPGGALIPTRDTIRIALVENEEAYQPHAKPWVENDYGVDLSLAVPFATSVRTKATASNSNLLSDASDLLVLDYRRVTDTDAKGNVSLVATRPGTVHGLQLWFDAELAEGIGFSNAPDEPGQIYGHNFFPFLRPVTLAAGDVVEVEVRASLVDGSYVWGWDSSIRRKDSTARELRFRQSSFGAKVISPASLEGRSSTFVPPPVERHTIDRLCLSLVDGHRSLSDIAERVRNEYPERFAAPAEALDYVVQLTTRYR